MASKSLICLDVGEKRIGVAVADTAVRIAVPLLTVLVDGHELEQLAGLIGREHADTVVLGYPRNQQGETTTQTDYVEQFAQRLAPYAPHIDYQDESLTSVLAEQHLKASGQPYEKADIDSQAAALILQDYLEVHYG